MFLVRRLLAQRKIAWALCLATLLLRLIVPGGYMVGAEQGRLVIQLCPGVVDLPAALAMPAGHDMHHGAAKNHDHAEAPCAFSTLIFAALGSVDPIQLAALLAFITGVTALVAVPQARVCRLKLRPPLRGPPALS